MTTILMSPPATVAMPTPYRLSVAQFHAMIDANVFGPEDRVELLDGLLVGKMTKHTPHTVATLLAQSALNAVLPSGFHVRNQEPIVLTSSVPEPDLVVVRGSVRDYLASHPGPADIALLIEVADASLAIDRGWKRRVYAEARVAVYWVVNLVDRVVEVHTDPHGTADAADYATAAVHRTGDAVPLGIGGHALPPVPVNDLLP